MRRAFWAAVGVALISMLFVNCKKDPTHLVQVISTEGGTVEGHNGEYKEGETIVFTAVPVDGYYFSQWSDGRTDNPRTVAVYGDITLTAQFSQYPLLTISASDNGTIDTEVNARYAPGGSVTVTAKPADGCGFMGWSDANTDNPRTITIGNEDISLTALFFAPTVDLGLESGTIWATCNVGAANPWDYGDYYAWGENQTKDDYSWETYKYCKGSEETLTKYCYDADYGNNGFTDTLTTLEVTDDAATAVLGADWAIPTNADWDELYSQCYWVLTDNYRGIGVAGLIGYKAKSAGDKGTVVYNDGTPSESYSLSDAHIFFPAAGYRWRNSLSSAGHNGYYWLASLSTYYAFDACLFQFNVGNRHLLVGNRCVGLSVRPVKRP